MNFFKSNVEVKGIFLVIKIRDTLVEPKLTG